MGNLDSFQYDQLSSSPNPLFANLTEIWAPLKLNFSDTFLIGGYFVQDIISQKLQVININSMYFFVSNLEVDDCNINGSPGSTQMVWFEQKLSDAQNGNYRVYIM